MPQRVRSLNEERTKSSVNVAVWVEQKMKQRGFVQNEPIIVLVIFGVLCLIIGLRLGAALRWPWVSGLTAGAGLFGLGVGVFALYVWGSIVQEKRIAERRKHEKSSAED